MKFCFFDRVRFFGILLAGSLFCACETTTSSGTDEDSTEAQSSIFDQMDEEALSEPFDYTGTYTGTLPCADCSGIRTEISLTDSTYVKRTVYLGGSKPEMYEASGGTNWDYKNLILTLGGITVPNRYLVGKNTLTQLDRQGKQIKGTLAEKYILQRR